MIRLTCETSDSSANQHLERKMTAEMKEEVPLLFPHAPSLRLHLAFLSFFLPALSAAYLSFCAVSSFPSLSFCLSGCLLSRFGALASVPY